MPILLVLLLTFFTNTDVMGKSTPLRSPLMGGGEGEGVIASEAKAVLTLSEAKQSPLPSPSMGEGKGGGVPEATKVQVQETYGKLPLYFIQNNGQMDGKVKFYEKGSGHSTFFTNEGVYISLVRDKETTSSADLHGRQNSSEQAAEMRRDRPSGLSSSFVITSGAKQSDKPGDKETLPLSPLGVRDGVRGEITSNLVKLTFLDANPNPEIITEGLQEGKVNYFIGNDPKKWRTNIQTYQAVLYKEVYPGIDIKFYGNNRQIEYDIIVKPGADPSQVRFAYVLFVKRFDPLFSNKFDPPFNCFP